MHASNVRTTDVERRIHCLMMWHVEREVEQTKELIELKRDAVGQRKKVV
jgi:hypothetical protein